MLGEESTWEKSPMFKLLTVLNSGYTAGVRVQVGLMSEFFNTASIRNLHFISPSEAGESQLQFTGCDHGNCCGDL